MKILYCDTSALAKRYLDEPGAEAVGALLIESPSFFTSVLTELEILSSIERAKGSKRIVSPKYRALVAAMEKDFSEGAIQMIAMGDDVLNLAKRLVRHRRLRAPAAIQLASALRLNRNTSGEVRFCCADRQLLEAARLEGLRCEDVSR